MRDPFRSPFEFLQGLGGPTYPSRADPVLLRYGGIGRALVSTSGTSRPGTLSWTRQWFEGFLSCPVQYSGRPRRSLVGVDLGGPSCVEDGRSVRGLPEGPPYRPRVVPGSPRHLDMVSNKGRTGLVSEMGLPVVCSGEEAFGRGSFETLRTTTLRLEPRVGRGEVKVGVRP